MQSRPTLADVARVAGVSKTAASLVLNGKGTSNVSEVTHERILGAARSLGFRPHGVARALSRRKADVLGVVGKIDPFVHESVHLFEHGVLSAIFRRALERGYNPLIFGFPADTDDVHQLSRYADGRSDAIILVNPPRECPLIDYLHCVGIPTVAICSRDPDPRGRWVDSDNEAGMRALVNHLADLGHRRIGYFVGPAGEDNARSRTQAFRSALAERGIPVREDWIVEFRWHVSQTHLLMRRLFTQKEPPTALLAWNDYAARVLCESARDLGIRVPEELSIAGFDDTPSASMAGPALTTVSQDLNLLGSKAVDLAVAAVSEESDTGRQTALCPVRLIIRESTAPAQAGGPIRLESGHSLAANGRGG